MIYDAASDTVVGSMGWLDHGALWVFDCTNATQRSVAIEGASHVSLRRGAGDLFRVVHHGSLDQAISIRHIADPGLELASLRIVGGQRRFIGDSALWKQVDASAIVQTPSGPQLLWIEGASETLTVLDLGWYNSETYDLGYQGLVDCLWLPEAGLVAVSVQRSSELVLIDPRQDRPAGTLSLAGRGGNPALSPRSGAEFLASDYDSLCVVDARTATVRCSAPLQEAAAHTQQFTGDYDAGRTHCAIARPFSGDVLLLDLATLAVTNRAPVAGQPMAVCMTSSSRFVTRDWKTGRVAVGDFLPS